MKRIFIHCTLSGISHGGYVKVLGLDPMTLILMCSSTEFSSAHTNWRVGCNVFNDNEMNSGPRETPVKAKAC